MGQEIHIKVDKCSDEAYHTIQDAINYASSLGDESVIIHVANGIYKEKLIIQKDNLSIYGESKVNCLIEYNNYANEILENGEKRGTFRTSSIFIDCNNFTAKHITFANTSGPGHEYGQALALYVDGDHMIFEDCNILGGQDTLFAAPLPEVAYMKDGFKGPKEYSPRIHGNHLYKDCYICGDVDFIFGSATCYFEHCNIYSNPMDKELSGFVCAPSTIKGKEGMVFNRCKFISDCPRESVYLARPWRNDARVIIMNSYIGSHIKREGFHDWDKLDARDSIFFAEFNNSGGGASLEHRAPFAKTLTEEESYNYTREKVLGF